MEKFSKENMEKLIKSVDGLNGLKWKLRHYAPDFEINDLDMIEEVKKELHKIGKELLPIFNHFNIQLSSGSQSSSSVKDQVIMDQTKGVESDSSGDVIENGIKLIELIGDKYVFVSSNRIKDNVKSLGIEPIKIIVAGGPISTEDLKAKNPNIPDKALIGIQKKIDVVFNKIKKTYKSGAKIIFLKSVNEETDDMIDKRCHLIQEMIGNSLERIEVNWENI